MTAITPDPALFRLKAFEAEWIAPLLEGPQWGRRLQRWGADESGAQLLRRALLFEGGEWVSLGQQLKAFAPTEALEDNSRLHRALDGDFRDRIRGSLGAYLDVSEMEFGRLQVWSLWAPSAGTELLEQAFTDLRPERLAHICLLLFAEDETWSTRIARLKTVVAELQRDPDRKYSLSAADAVSWALDGSVSALPPSLITPARWRGTLFEFRRQPQRKSDRLSELRDLKREIWRTLTGTVGQRAVEYRRESDLDSEEP